MIQIYTEMYVLDKYLVNRPELNQLADTLQVYEPVFNKYGYTFDEYDYSVSYYMKDPKRFAKLFEKVKINLDKKITSLERRAKLEDDYNVTWDLLLDLEHTASDSIIGNGYFRALNIIFFKPDTVSYKSHSTVLIDSIYKFPPQNIFELYDIIPTKADDYIPLTNFYNYDEKDSSKLHIPDKPKTNSKRLHRAN